MSETHFHCPQCRQAFKAPNEVRGQRFDCPKCARRQSVPYSGVHQIIRPITVAFQAFRKHNRRKKFSEGTPEAAVGTLSGAIRAADGAPSTATLARFGVVRMVSEPAPSYDLRSAVRVIGFGIGIAVLALMILAPGRFWQIVGDVFGSLALSPFELIGLITLGMAVFGAVAVLIWLLLRFAAAHPLPPETAPQNAPTVILPASASEAASGTWPLSAAALLVCGIFGAVLMTAFALSQTASDPKTAERVETVRENGNTILTTYRGSVPVRRRIEFGGDAFKNAEGPLSESGKLHGHWVVNVLDNSDEDLNLETVHGWFWYGEEITEGEWHLRERGISR